MALFNLEKKEEKVEEKWVWVDGYKGTRKDMTCHDYQYELGKRHDMPEDAEIEECRSGFHMCLNLKDVFMYYDIGDDHRFFKVRALVREDDVARYNNRGRLNRRDKLVAKSIEFISECSIDEIFSAALPEAELKERWTDEDKIAALTIGIREASKIIATRTLVAIGYSTLFAAFLVDNGMFQMAEAVGSQPDLSIDTKVWLIMTSLNRKELEDQRRHLEARAQMAKSFNF